MRTPGLTGFLLLLTLVLGTSRDAQGETEPSDDLTAAITEAKDLWRRSCKLDDSEQGCVVLRSQPSAHRCQDAQEILRPATQRHAMAARAQRALQRAIASASQTPELAKGNEAALASARYLVAESALVAFLAIESPSKLNFDDRNAKRRKRSTTRFKEFVREARAAAEKAADAFAAVAPASTNLKVAVLAQSARVHIHLAQLFYAIEIPEDVRTGAFAEESRAAFCDALHEQARPLEEKGIQLAQSCIEASFDTSSPWTRICEDLARPRLH